MHGSHLVKAYSQTHSNIALSPGQAEFYALVATASEALGLVAMTEDFGDKLEAYLYAYARCQLIGAGDDPSSRYPVALAAAGAPEAPAGVVLGTEPMGPRDKTCRFKAAGRARMQHGM